MVTTEYKPHKEQLELEEKATAILSTNPDREKKVEEVFGPMEDWVFDVGEGWKLMLIPFTRRWWFFDPLHETWDDTGIEIGEAAFVLDGKILKAETIRGENALDRNVAESESEPEPAAAAKFCTHCGHAIHSDERFCRGCGEPLHLKTGKESAG